MAAGSRCCDLPVDERQDLDHAWHQYSSEVPQHWAETGGLRRTLADKWPVFRVKFSNVDSVRVLFCKQRVRGFKSPKLHHKVGRSGLAA